MSWNNCSQVVVTLPKERYAKILYELNDIKKKEISPESVKVYDDAFSIMSEPNYSIEDTVEHTRDFNKLDVITLFWDEVEWCGKAVDVLMEYITWSEMYHYIRIGGELDDMEEECDDAGYEPVIEPIRRVRYIGKS